MNAYLIDVMSKGQKIVFNVLVGLWLATLVWFWSWWMQLGHVVTITGFLITSFVLFWSTMIPLWYFYFVGRMKRPNPNLSLPKGRVAIIVTKAPSEPWEVVQKTLNAMLEQDFPSYDVWLADEDPSEETRAWCASHRVSISCRNGITKYHNKKWPRRTKCKEGNLAYFYDTYGYEKYDFVAQMDADHIPTESYLRNMVAPFINPKVGYVAAPSICDSNFDISWTVRARLYAEAHFHGSLQTGYNGDGWAPLCIGSHYAVRTRALKEIGGLGPELAEDHSTSLMMNNGGWDGAFAFDAIAHGDGAGSFGDSMTQEFQWSRSLVNILLTWMPKYSKGLTIRKKIQFGFSQYWYPLFALQMSIAIVSPTVALFIGIPWVSVSYWECLLRFLILTAMCLLPAWFIRRNGWFRPQYAPIISWETILFQLVRWPWMVYGVMIAFFDAVFHHEFKFKVTPKGANTYKPLHIGLMLPYSAIIVLVTLSVIFTGMRPYVEGYRWLALLDCTIYAIVLVLIIHLHKKENARSTRSVFSAIPASIMSLVSIVLLVVAVGVSLPKLQEIIAAEKPTYVAIRPQIGPTKMPTMEPIPFFVGIPTLIPIFPTPTLEPVIELPKGKMLTGMYDPDGMFADIKWDISHSFTDWNYPDQIHKAIVSAQEIRQFPLITVEPYHRPGSDPAMLLQDIVAGKYDDIIVSMMSVMKQRASQKIIIRWGHEMDLCTQYEWSTCVEEDWISAYKYVITMARREGVANALWMWSPAGNSNARQFWPGPDYVDFIGTTIVVSEDWDRAYKVEKPWPRPMSIALYQRYRNTTEGFNKPLIIVEFGVSYSDPNVDRSKWLIEAFNEIKDREAYPMLVGFLHYQYIAQSRSSKIVLPDFRLTRKELFTALDAVGGF